MSTGRANKPYLYSYIGVVMYTVTVLMIVITSIVVMGVVMRYANTQENARTD